MSEGGKILELLVRRAPNWVSLLTIRERLPEYQQNELDRSISELVEAGRVVEVVDEQAGIKQRYVRLADYSSIPVRESIKVGTVEVPRVLASSGVTYVPETINEIVERLAEQSETLEQSFVEMVRKQQERYWANVVGVFGIFASVITLIVATLPNLNLDSTLPFWPGFLANLMILLPLAIVLGVFTVCVRLVIR